MQFNYTLQSIKKHIAYELDKESYTNEEVIGLLKAFLSAIDMTMFEYLQKDADWIKESAKIKASQFEYNGIF